jgi:hypothetical protein
LSPFVNGIDIEGMPGIILNNPPYRLGNIMRIGVRIEVTNSATPVEGAKVDFEVQKGTGASATKISGYELSADSDNNGEVYYFFQLDDNDFDEEEAYTIKIKAKKNLKTDETTVTFTISKGLAAISVDLDLDKGYYNTAEEVQITVQTSVVPGHSQPNNYVYTIYSGSSTYLKEPRTIPSHTYTLPAGFEGQMCFKVEVYNQDGDYGMDSNCVWVYFAVLVVNANPQLYNPNGTINVNYELKSALMTNPTYYYVVEDSTGAPVEEGETSGGSFTYDVPAVPSSSYRIYVYAYQNGREVSDYVWVSLDSGFYLSITFDRDIYSLGDTMTISYSISKRGDSQLPAKFQFSFSLMGGPGQVYESDESSGQFTYNIPSGGMDEGTLLFTVTESSTGAGAIESITVRGGNPLWWAKLAEIPAFDIILLILIIILFIMFWRMRRGAPARAREEEAVTPEGEAVAPPPPPPAGTAPVMEASAAPSALSVPCKSCGTGIELTTSKRPIEVMCPSCGETQMVY